MGLPYRSATAITTNCTELATNAPGGRGTASSSRSICRTIVERSHGRRTGPLPPNAAGDFEDYPTIADADGCFLQRRVGSWPKLCRVAVSQYAIRRRRRHARRRPSRRTRKSVRRVSQFGAMKERRGKCQMASHRTGGKVLDRSDSSRDECRQISSTRVAVCSSRELVCCCRRRALLRGRVATCL